MKAFPTANGAISRAAYELAMRAEVDADDILRTAGLTKAAITDRAVRIDARTQIKILGLVADSIRDEFLGIRLAERFELRELGLLYYVQSSSETLGDALQRLARYSTIHNEGVELRCHEREGISITFDYVGVTRSHDCHQIEFFVVTTLRLCRQLTGRRLCPTSIKLMHRRDSVPEKWKALLGCPVEFGSAVDEIIYPRSAASLPLVGFDPYLNSLLEDYCKETLAKRSKRSASWQSRVENAIAPLLPHGKARLGDVSRTLGISRRTLIRLLAAEGQTFSALLEGLRRDLAKRYLEEISLSIAEIAWLLGYREASAFNHAFKRWNGMAPRKSRARIRP